MISNTLPTKMIQEQSYQYGNSCFITTVFLFIKRAYSASRISTYFHFRARLRDFNVLNYVNINLRILNFVEVLEDVGHEN